MPDLLDTNVVSELRKPRPDPNVLRYFADRRPVDLYLSAVTLAEIRYGILVAQPSRKHALEVWLEDEVRAFFEGQILPVTESVILRWRVLMAQGRSIGTTHPQPDLLVAATALEHNLTLVTRNTRDFAGIPGLQLLNPWEPV